MQQLPGLSQDECQRLATQGIHTTLELLQHTSNPERRTALASQLQVNSHHIQKWIALADLSSVPSVGCQYCGLLLHAGVGSAVGREVGVDDVRAGLLPEDKVTAIQELLTKHEMVAMIGDGVNDAPALANATVGIAMGGAGTAVALETADVALMADDLGRLPFAVGLSRQARAVIRQNLWLSRGVIAGLVVATVSGVLPSLVPRFRARSAGTAHERSPAGFVRLSAGERRKIRFR